MSDEEVDELLKAVDTSSGEINYTGKNHLSGLIYCQAVWLMIRLCRSREDDSGELGCFFSFYGSFSKTASSLLLRGYWRCVNRRWINFLGWQWQGEGVKPSIYRSACW